MAVCMHAQLCPPLRAHGLYSANPFHPWDFPGNNTGGLSFPSSEDLLDPVSPAAPALASRFFLPLVPTGRPKKSVVRKSIKLQLRSKKVSAMLVKRPQESGPHHISSLSETALVNVTLVQIGC